MSDIDIALDRPLRLGIATGDSVQWATEGEVERVRGIDLSDLARRCARVRRDHPGVDVVADIDVVIAAEARAARALVDTETAAAVHDTMLYVGTPSGLAGLIADIHAIGIADGAVLIPQSSVMADLIRDAVLPVLRTMVTLPAMVCQARPA